MGAFLVLSLVAAPLLAQSGSPRPTPQGPPTDPVDLLRVRLWELEGRPSAARYDGMPALLETVDRLEWELEDASGTRREAILAVLLDLAGLGLEPDGLALGARLEERPRASRYRRLGLDALERHLEREDGRSAAWIEHEVLLLPDRHPPSRRAAALALFDREHPAGGELALLSIARRADDPLRPAALTLAASWPSPATDLFGVRQLARPRDRLHDPHPVTLLLHRLRDSREPLAPAASHELAQRLSIWLLSSDWRETARALELARGLDLPSRVPLLIESLRVWERRTREGRGGSTRIANDLLMELRTLSRRSFGPDPERWWLWWRRVRSGEIPFRQPDAEPAPGATRAEFFGLRPVSDRITFVIDRSGSMDSEWGTSGRTRYQEAVLEMIRFLQASGDQTFFNVILFNRDTLLSSIGLRRATPDHLELARRALSEEPVGGGTRLRPAIELALRVAGGGVDLETLEADTVVVLCDGQTEEGPGWVRDFLERYNVTAQVQFHCVLLGTTADDDGTLALLAGLTGGEFLRVGG